MNKDYCGPTLISSINQRISMKSISKMKEWTTRLKNEVYAINLARKDPRVPWYAKGLAVCVIGYVFSPIDFIPDFVPVLGLLDDIVVIPLGAALVIKLIPAEVMADCRQKALEASQSLNQQNWLVGGIIIFIWIALLALILILLRRALMK
jgi:uncharacterized membrane protein YkvA (DUF1232 family)